MMNIIEKLGGYESAKDVWGWNEDGWSYWNPKTKRYAHSTNDSEYLNIDELEDDLLKYRRENNIFDVGDKVVSTLDGDEDWKNAVCEILAFHKKMAITTGFSCAIHHYDYRHATDAEIKAGHRL